MALPKESYNKDLLADLDNAVEAAKEMFANKHSTKADVLGDIATEAATGLKIESNLEDQERILQEKIDRLAYDLSFSDWKIPDENLISDIKDQFKIEPSLDDPTQLVINRYDGTNRLTSLNISGGIFSHQIITNLSVPAELQITKLVCNDLKIESIKELPLCLVELSCSNNILTKLPELPKTLQKLDCRANKLQFLPLELPGSLKELTANYNEFYVNELDRIKNMPIKRIIV